MVTLTAARQERAHSMLMRYYRVNYSHWTEKMAVVDPPPEVSQSGRQNTMALKIGQSYRSGYKDGTLPTEGNRTTPIIVTEAEFPCQPHETRTG